METKYKLMSKSQLKKHLLDNRHDQEALRELKSRPKQNVITIPANTSVEEQERILKQVIKQYE